MFVPYFGTEVAGLSRLKIPTLSVLIYEGALKINKPLLRSDFRRNSRTENGKPGRREFRTRAPALRAAIKKSGLKM